MTKSRVANSRWSIGSLLTNAINLMLSSGINAGLGFVFWIVVARTAKASSVGVATSLIGLSILIGFVGLVGLDVGMVRFLAHSKEPTQYISSALMVSGVTTCIASLIAAAIIPVASSKLSFVDHNPLYLFAFISTNVFTAWNTLTNAVFVSQRRTKHIVWINIVAGMAKLLAVVIASSFGAATIFGLYGFGQFVNVVLSAAVIIWLFHHRLSLLVNPTILRPTVRFSLGTYIGTVLYWLPTTLMPIIILENLGSKEAAYFYVAFTIVTVLYTIPSSVMLSLYAEGSYDARELSSHGRKAIITSWSLLVPAVLVVSIFSPLILGVFGAQYRGGAQSLLILLSVSAFLITLILLSVTLFRISLDYIGVIFAMAVFACSTIGLSLLFIHRFQLKGIGFAWLAGCLLTTLVGMVLLRIRDGLTFSGRRIGRHVRIGN